MRDLTLDWEEIDSAIRNGWIDDLRKHHKMIHYFGLGFIQIKMCDKYRVHVYSTRIDPIVPEESVHDHRYAFQSKVVLGSITQRLYSLTDGDDHIMTEETCREEDPAHQRIETPCGIVQVSESTYGTGSRYWIHSTVLHRIERGPMGAVTLVTRSPIVKEFARVVTKRDEKHVCPFSKKFSEEELWGIVESELKGHQR